MVFLERGPKGLYDIRVIRNDVLDIWRPGLDAPRSRGWRSITGRDIAELRCRLVVYQSKGYHRRPEHTSPGGADSMKAARAAVSVAMMSLDGEYRKSSGGISRYANARPKQARSS